MKLVSMKYVSIVLGLFSALVIMTSCGTSNSSPGNGQSGSVQNAAQVPTTSEKAMPDFSLLDLDGHPVKLSDYDGKAVLVNFWATWCPPCKAEIPDLIAVQKEYGGENFTILGISMDQAGPAVVKSFVEDRGINYPVLMGNLDVVSDYGNFRGIPTTFLLNKKHEKVQQYIGQIDKDQLTADLEAIAKAST